jgi:hypothetical protein
MEGAGTLGKFSAASCFIYQFIPSEWAVGGWAVKEHDVSILGGCSVISSGILLLQTTDHTLMPGEVTR